MKKSQLKAPLTRPILTEAVRERSSNEASTQSSKEIMATELARLEKMPKMPGVATIQMMQEFKKFP